MNPFPFASDLFRAAFGRKGTPQPKAASPVKTEATKPDAKVQSQPKVNVGERAQFSRKAELFVEEPARIDAHVMMRGIVGAYTYIRQGTRVGAGTALIGRYCSIAPGAAIGDGQHPLDWLSTHPFQHGERFWLEDVGEKFDRPLKREAKARVIIGNDVWIGANAIVMSGLVVGDGAVIAAGAIVTKDVPPYAVVAGVPARIIKFRFPLPVVRRLLALRWWRFRATELAEVPFDDVEAAIAEIERREKAGLLKPYRPGTVRVSHGGKETVTAADALEGIRIRYANACKKTGNPALLDKAAGS